MWGLYVGEETIGAFKIEQASEKKNIMGELNEQNQIPDSRNKNYFGIVASRSHLTKETEEFIENLKKEHGNVKMVSKGSSLKICLVAEGEADIYPRFAPTSEWDTAAGCRGCRCPCCRR